MAIDMTSGFLLGQGAREDEIKVRKVVTPSGRGVRGYFPSRKMGRMVAWESLLERDAILLLEYSPAVIRYAEQPTRVNFLHDGKIRSYIPDFQAEIYNIGYIYVEVKPSAKLVAGSKIANRLDSITSHYRGTGIAFRVLTEKEVRRQPRLKNLQLLAYHAGRIHPATRQARVDRLSVHEVDTIAGAMAVLGDLKLVYQLLADGVYHCELDYPITLSTAIYRSVEGECHAPFHF